MSVTLSLGDRITLGNGAGDIVNDSEGVSNRITLGNGPILACGRFTWPMRIGQHTSYSRSA